MVDFHEICEERESALLLDTYTLYARAGVEKRLFYKHHFNGPMEINVRTLKVIALASFHILAYESGRLLSFAYNKIGFGACLRGRFCVSFRDGEIRVRSLMF